MSRFLWVTEAFRTLYRPSVSWREFSLEAELLVDFTSSPLTDDFVAGFALGNYFEMTPDETDPRQAISHGVKLKMKGPYYGFARDPWGISSPYAPLSARSVNP